MGTYCTIKGELQYIDKKSYNDAVKILEEGSWVKDGYFVGEDNAKISEDKILFPKTLTIEIPYGLHRNLGRLFYKDRLFKGIKDCFITETCTDGDSYGNVYFPKYTATQVHKDLRIPIEVETVGYTLDEYAQLIGIEVVKWDGENEDQYDKYAEYQSNVEDSFHDTDWKGLWKEHPYEVR